MTYAEIFGLLKAHIWLYCLAGTILVGLPTCLGYGTGDVILQQAFDGEWAFGRSFRYDLLAAKPAVMAALAGLGQIYIIALIIDRSIASPSRLDRSNVSISAKSLIKSPRFLFSVVIILILNELMIGNELLFLKYSISISILNAIFIYTYKELQRNKSGHILRFSMSWKNFLTCRVAIHMIFSVGLTLSDPSVYGSVVELYTANAQSWPDPDGTTFRLAGASLSGILAAVHGAYIAAICLAIRRAVPNTPPPTLVEAFS